MRLARWAGILVAVLLAACTSNGSGDQGERTSPVGAAASPTLLPRLVLTAQLSERPGKWNRVASIPFGDGREDLGFVPAGRHTPVSTPGSRRTRTHYLPKLDMEIGGKADRHAGPETG